MPELLAVVFAFPTVVFTVLLGVVLVYWLFVVLGAVHIDGLGGDHSGLLDGGGAHGIDVGDVHGVDLDGGAGGDGDLDAGDNDGALGAVANALHLKSAPASVVLSVLITLSWLLSVLAMEAVTGVLTGVAHTIAGVAVFVVAPMIALVLTSFVVRPLARLFVPHTAKGHRDLVGKVCVVRTGSVDAGFGEATMEDGGAGLVVRVRVDGESALRRGDQAIIVAWDEARDAFTVAPLSAEDEEMLAAGPRREKSSK